MTDRTCGERWMIVLLTPMALAASLSAIAGLFWWADSTPWSAPYREASVGMLVVLYPVCQVMFSIAGWVTMGRESLPEPEPSPDPATVIDPPISNLPRRQRDFDDRFEQTHAGPGPTASWRALSQPKLPDGLTRGELIEWLFDARDGNATFAVRDSRKGKGGRSRSFSGDLSADDVTANVRAFLATYDVIEIDGSGQWQWDVMKDPLFDALLRGEGFGILMRDDTQ